MLEFSGCGNITLIGIAMIQQFIQSRFTLYRQEQLDHTRGLALIKTQLTKEIPGLLTDVYEEVVDACKQYLPVKDGMFLSGTLTLWKVTISPQNGPVSQCTKIWRQ